MWVRVLGSSQVALGEDPAATVDLGARKPRSVVAALAMRLGSEVSPDALVDLVWGDEPPRGAHGTLHSYLSGVRRVLEPGLGPRQKPTVLLTSDHGYRLDLRRDHVDAHLFTDEVRAVRRALAPLATQFSTGPAPDWPDRTTISGHVDRLEELLGLWRGEAYADLPDQPDVVLERSSLEQLRRGAEEDRVLGLLALGDHAVVVAATEQATVRHPLQERVWALHALALARSGRQAESLAALRHIRTVLADELGLDPGQELRDLEQAVLVQEPGLQQWLRPEPSRVSAPPTEASAPAERRAAGWGTVGREQEVAELDGVLDRAAGGDPTFALLVGEPGIGKSRLVERVSERAREHEFVVATGRCAQDDGAPPLWPWSQALDELGRHDQRVLDVEVERLLSGDVGTDDSTMAAERQAFRAWESIAHEVLTRSEASPVLLVIEDLHWADTASLKVVRRLLAATHPGQRLAVLLTRRPYPEPTGSLADLGEDLARAHAVRLDLGGLDADQALALVEAVTGAPHDPAVVAQWHDRSGGNPFFLIELARLGDRDDAGAVPATVRDVIARRFGTVPERTRSLLLLTAALGRRCSLDVLAAVDGGPAVEVEDALDPAREAGLVTEPEVGTVAFTHALTRDAVLATTSASRVARLHAQIAHALDEGGSVASLVGPDERVAELARHWLAAGPSYAGRAWRAALDAAAQARRTFSWVEAANLMSAAVEAHRRDPAGNPEERIDLLLTQAGDCRPNSEWDQVLPLAAEAVALARRQEDVERLAAAAAAGTDGLVWVPQQWYEVPEDTIDDLRWALGRLPKGDSPDRCRVMLALAVLLYYEPTARAEAVALADEGHAMARRSGDAALIAFACHAAWKALWWPEHAERRLALAEEALEATREAGDADAEAVAQVLLAGILLELGDVERYASIAESATRFARRRNNSYALMAMLWLDLSLSVLRENGTAAAADAADLIELRPRLNPVNEALQVAGVQLFTMVWTEHIGMIVEPLMQARQGAEHDFAREVLILALARSGRIEELRRELVDPVVYRVDNWSSVSAWCIQAEASAVAGDTRLAEQMIAELTPISGRFAVSGISTTYGPVDGFLALALAAVGRRDEARARADHALSQAEAWQLPAYVAWLTTRRTELAF